MSRHNSVARIDARRLANDDVLRLRLRNTQHGFELSRLHNFRQRRALRNPLAELQQQILQHPRFRRAH